MGLAQITRFGSIATAEGCASIRRNAPLSEFVSCINRSMEALEIDVYVAFRLCLRLFIFILQSNSLIDLNLRR